MKPNTCNHDRVEFISRCVARATWYGPVEWEDVITCRDCGAELDQVPEDADEIDGEYEPPLRGLPDEYYD